MKRTLIAVLAIVCIFSLTGCSPSKQGKVISVDATIPLSAMLGGDPIRNEDVVFANIVTVETDNGKQYRATWDEQLLEMPVSFDLRGLVVTIERSDDPKLWKVTAIVPEP